MTKIDTMTTTDPRPVLADALDELQRILDGIPADRMTGPTPCTGLDVATLVGHVHMVLERIVCAGRSVPVDRWPMDAVFVEETERAAWERAAIVEIGDAWADDDALLRERALPWGTYPGPAVLGVYTSEVVVHGWDLAVSTGQDVHFSDESVAQGFAALQAQMPDEGRQDLLDAIASLTPEGSDADLPFTLAADAGDDPSPLDRLVAWSGRDPAWRPWTSL